MAKTRTQYLSSKEFLKTMGSNIKNVRKKKGFSQKELADKCKMARPYITLLELGSRNPTLLSLYSISKALRLKKIYNLLQDC